MGRHYPSKKCAHWSVRNRNKKLRKEEKAVAAEEGDENRAADSPNLFDRRQTFNDLPHPGSYSIQYFADKKKKEQDNLVDEEEAKKEVTVEVKGNATAVEVESSESKITKKRFALLFGYTGSNYAGLQMNPGVNTVEAEIEKALFEMGAIAECNYGFLQKIGWSRAGRTDKGVHAAGQVLTAKLQIDESDEAFLEKLNARLPQDIQVHACIRTTKNFHAKNGCDKRTYEYYAPTFAFSTLACAKDQDGNALHSDDQKDYRMDEATCTKLNEILRIFVGTHNFHNYTSKLLPGDSKCQRYIISFEAEKPFCREGLEWIKLKVVGQSFLLNHIRKMIGLSMDYVRRSLEVSTIFKSFELEKMDIPKAPSDGLYLAQAHFDCYNNKNGKDHSLIDINSPETLQRINSFKQDVILAHIVEQEKTRRPFCEWIRNLDEFPCDYRQIELEEYKKMKQEQSLSYDVGKVVTALGDDDSDSEPKKRKRDGDHDDHEDNDDDDDDSSTKALKP